jgi:hypothetical protein
MCKMAAIVVTSPAFHHLREGQFPPGGKALMKLLFSSRNGAG